MAMGRNGKIAERRMIQDDVNISAIPRFPNDRIAALFKGLQAAGWAKYRSRATAAARRAAPAAGGRGPCIGVPR
jgi:hypothetical protein